MKLSFNWLVLLIYLLNACESSSFVDGQNVPSEKKSEDLLAEAGVTDKDQPEGGITQEEETPPEVKLDSFTLYWFPVNWTIEIIANQFFLGGSAPKPPRFDA